MFRKLKHLTILIIIMNQRKVILCGTHPFQFNGYSKVVYELANEISKFEDIQLHIFGFQNFYHEKSHEKERTLPPNILIYDAFNSEEPKNKGFGEKLIVEYVKNISPDVVIIYNDLVVISALTKNLLSIPDRKFKLIPYIDVVYKNEKHSLIKFINDSSDGGIAFTEYWKECLIEQKFTKPLWTLEHAFNKNAYFPIPKHVARKFFDLSQEHFIVLNLNRNQPRKRWDHCIMAYMKFISKNRHKKIKLLVMTAVKGAWDLSELIYIEANKYGMTIQEAKDYFIFIQNPQKLSDNEINIMYNAADCGFSTAAGEGFGLCNFEQAGVGIPQIIPNVGGFKDFFNNENSIPIEPKISIMGDTTQDSVSGEQELCMIDDYVDALHKYYTDKNLRDIHGTVSRNDITKYTWKEKANKFRNIVMEATQDLYTPDKSDSILSQINDIITNKNDDNDDKIDADVNNDIKVNSYNSSNSVTDLEEKVKTKTIINDDDELDIDKLIDQKITKKLNQMNNNDFDEKKLNTLEKNELMELQNKIAKLLNT